MIYKPEKEFQKIFIKMARKKYPERMFLGNFPLPYDETAPKGDAQMPWYFADIVEVDEQGNFHLWELKTLYKSNGKGNDQIKRGDVIGQLITYDFIFCTAEYMENGINTLRNRFLKTAKSKLNQYKDHPLLQKIKRKRRFDFSSINLVICGGYGYEMSAGFGNIIWHLYSGALDCSHVNENLSKKMHCWHFYQTSNGYDLRNLWELSSIDLNGKNVIFGKNKFEINNQRYLQKFISDIKLEGLHKDSYKAYQKYEDRNYPDAPD